MNIAQFKDIVSGYMLRQSAALTSPLGADLITLAANHAKKFAQRRHNFELNRVTVTVVVSPLPAGGDLATAVLYQTATPVKVKSIERAYLVQPTTGQFFPLHIISRSYDASHMRKRIDLNTLNLFERFPPPPPPAQLLDPYLIRQNNMVYLSQPITSPTTVQLDVVQWMPDYGTLVAATSTAILANTLVDAAASFVVNGVQIGDVVLNVTTGAQALVTSVLPTQLGLNANIFLAIGNAYTVVTRVPTDFLLDEAEDYMLYRSITELNFFLKEDERVQISQAKMDEAWQSVLAWDNSLVENTAEDPVLD